jgi:hypothetical protein
MPHEEPDSTSYHTVEHGQEEPSEGRYADALETTAGRPLSSTINPSPQHGGGFSICDSSNLNDSLGSAPTANPRVCCTKVVHKQHARKPKSPLPSTDLAGADCCTKLVHNRAQTVSRTAGPKPSGNGRSEPSPRLPSRSRRSLGLIVRGRVFYLRLRVPRSLEASVGRTHVWRSSMRKLAFA